jgi:hypothetical protein
MFLPEPRCIEGTQSSLYTLSFDRSIGWIASKLEREPNHQSATLQRISPTTQARALEKQTLVRRKKRERWKRRRRKLLREGSEVSYIGHTPLFSHLSTRILILFGSISSLIRRSSSFVLLQLNLHLICTKCRSLLLMPSRQAWFGAIHQQRTLNTIKEYIMYIAFAPPPFYSSEHRWLDTVL